MALESKNEYKPERGEPEIDAESLFYPDDFEILEADSLRDAAREGVESSSLLQRCHEGDEEAMKAMMIGFMPFIWAYEERLRKMKLPRGTLFKRFDRSTLKSKIRGLQQVHDRIKILERSVHEQGADEREHGEWWVKGAKNLGIQTRGRSIPGPEIRAVRKLSRFVTNSSEPSAFFARAAGVEFVAEELSKFVMTPEFLEQFKNKRWVWGDIHRLTHGDPRTTHLGLDLDLARAYAPLGMTDEKAKRYIQKNVVETVNLFYEAARATERRLARRRLH